jgi:hypothetical protein
MRGGEVQFITNPENPTPTFQVFMTLYFVLCESFGGETIVEVEHAGELTLFATASLRHFVDIKTPDYVHITHVRNESLEVEDDLKFKSVSHVWFLEKAVVYIKKNVCSIFMR